MCQYYLGDNVCEHSSLMRQGKNIDNRLAPHRRYGSPLSGIDTYSSYQEIIPVFPHLLQDVISYIFFFWGWSRSHKYEAWSRVNYYGCFVVVSGPAYGLLSLGSLHRQSLSGMLSSPVCLRIAELGLTSHSRLCLL